MPTINNPITTSSISNATITTSSNTLKDVYVQSGNTTSSQWSNQSNHYWVGPNTTAPGVNPNPSGINPATSPPPITITVEVLVRKCPSCEEVKRVDEDWTDEDYICNECRGF